MEVAFLPHGPGDEKADRAINTAGGRHASAQHEVATRRALSPNVNTFATALTSRLLDNPQLDEHRRK
jgi:hypothetical protein